MTQEKEKYHIHSFLKNKTYKLFHCVVDTKNLFTFKKKSYYISEKLKSYKVHNPPRKLSDGKWNNWTNECEMDWIYVVVEDNGKIHFFDQEYYRIHPCNIGEL